MDYFFPLVQQKRPFMREGIKGRGKKREQEGTYASARRAVPSALSRVTAVFGMGTGGACSLNPSARKGVARVFNVVIADGWG